MKETTILKRELKRTVGGKLYEATAELHSHGDQKPYFAVTNADGSDHETILKGFPELAPVVALHLCNEDGQPMHAVANGVYHIQKRDLKAVMSHFRIDEEEAKQLIDSYFWERDKQEEEVESLIAADKGAFSEINRSRPTGLRSISSYEHEPYRVADIDAKEFSAWAARFNDFLNQSEVVSNLEILSEDKISCRKVDNGHNLAIGTAEEILYALDRISRVGFGTQRLSVEGAYKEMKKIRQSANLLEKVFSSKKALEKIVSHFLEAPVSGITMLAGNPHSMSVWVKDIIDTRYAKSWKEEAEAAKEFLKLPDLVEIEELEEDGPLAITPGGDKLDPEVMSVSYLPMLDFGGPQYYVAPSSEEAGRAAEKYWTDMVKNDPEEFACLVGKDTLVQWAMGRPAGPGSEKVRSLEEWLEVVKQHPQEQFASYDGEEVQLQINEALAEELGFDFEPDSNGFMEVVGYRC